MHTIPGTLKTLSSALNGTYSDIDSVQVTGTHIVYTYTYSIILYYYNIIVMNECVGIYVYMYTIYKRVEEMTAERKRSDETTPVLTDALSLYI